jgi:hypothetical protein
MNKMGHERQNIGYRIHYSFSLLRTKCSSLAPLLPKVKNVNLQLIVICSENSICIKYTLTKNLLYVKALTRFYGK